MTKKLYRYTLLCMMINLSMNLMQARMTEDKFSDIQACENESFNIHDRACLDRIYEEMCDGQVDENSKDKDLVHAIKKELTPEIILHFIKNIQIYVDKIKDTQNINHETVNTARLAVYDVAKARKMLPHTISAEVQTEIRHATESIDRHVIELEDFLKGSKL